MTKIYSAVNIRISVAITRMHSEAEIPREYFPRSNLARILARRLFPWNLSLNEAICATAAIALLRGEVLFLEVKTRLALK